MTLASRLLGILLLLAPLPAAAEMEAAPWGEIEIPYERTEWIASVAEDGRGLILLCIAADCPRFVRLYAWVVPEGGEAEEPAWRGPKPIALDDPALPFLAYELWSGCRAKDLPILTAALLFRGALYRLSSIEGGGCNFGPQLPVGRFKRLVESIRPRDMRSLAIGEVRLSYDAGRWSVSHDRPGEGAAGAWLTCMLRECRGSDGKQAKVSIGTAPATDRSCVPGEAPDGGSVRDGGSKTYGGLALRRWKTFSGCRAYTPAEETACGVHTGIAYRFASGLHSGCSAGIEGVPEALFSEILSGISLAGDMPAAP